MKITFVLVDDTGRSFQGAAVLTPASRTGTHKAKVDASASIKTRNARPTKSSAAVETLDFEANERAFIKKHARSLSGPKKFVLLLSYVVKGKIGQEAQLKDIEKHWNRMTSSNLLDGKFNRFYSNMAKEQGWVNTKRKGSYFLRPSWKDILL